MPTIPNLKSFSLPSVLLFCLLFCGSHTLSAVDLFYTFNQFYSPEQGTYIETALNIPTASLELKENANGSLSAAVDLTIVFTKEDGQVAAYDKYNLQSPEFASKKEAMSALVDVKRFVLPAGSYNMEITYKDQNSDAEAKSINEKVLIEFNENRVQISDISLLEEYGEATEEDPFYKNGLRLVPYVLGYYPNTFTRLKFYAEIYNSNLDLGKDATYLVNYYIGKHGENKATQGKKGFKKQTAAPVNVLLAEMEMDDLGSGNYNLMVEVRNKQNELLEMKGVFFQRNNRMQSVGVTDLNTVDISDSFVEELGSGELDYALGALIPIVSDNQATYIDNLRLAPTIDLKSKRQYLLNYWVDVDPHYPEDSYKEYMTVVDAVEQTYASKIRRGFETDRGLVFLKYGKPTFVDYQAGIAQANHPYEIWHYDNLKSQSNIRFIFYDPDLSSNEFVLLHSDLRGEINDPSWKATVFQQMDPSLRQDIDLQDKSRSNSSDRIIGEKPPRVGDF